MASTGTYISAVGHAGLLAWLLAGWGLSSEPLDLDTTIVTVISSDDFARAQQRSTPTPSVADPTAPTVPEVEAQPELPEPDVAPEITPPTPTEQPVDELPPPEPPEPLAQAEVTDEVPDVTPPSLNPSPAIDAPIVSERPQPRAADRVAPTPVAPPEPDVAIADVDQQATEPADAPEEPTAIEPEEATAQEETATEIVTEADTPSGAVETSLRPTARPNRPAPVEEPQETETAAAEPVEQPASDTNETVENLLADIVNEQPDVPQGPPMTGSETEGFRIAVNNCWNVDPGSMASRVRVEVEFDLTPEGKVVGNKVTLVSAEGDAGATQIAFEAARRAILRCQGQGGYDLPAEKYGQWDQVTAVFDPSGMR